MAGPAGGGPGPTQACQPLSPAVSGAALPLAGYKATSHSHGGPTVTGRPVTVPGPTVTGTAGGPGPPAPRLGPLISARTAAGVTREQWLHGQLFTVTYGLQAVIYGPLQLRVVTP